MGREKRKEEKALRLCIVSSTWWNCLFQTEYKGKLYEVLVEKISKKENKRKEFLEEYSNPKCPFKWYALVWIDANNQIVKVFRDESCLDISK